MQGFQKSKLIRLSGLAALLLSASSAHAYYDDVHYGLTYYIARQTGFTSQQAYRIASACSEVDWDERTEPVQLGAQLQALLSPLGGNIHQPRMRFHAFRNESDPVRQVIGNEPDGMAAQDEVMKSLQDLFKFTARVTKNPGVYLHALQDVVPHHGYGTFWGHNPAQYSYFERHIHQGMIMGSTTDWVAARPADVLQLCDTTNAHLIPLLKAISPHQFVRLYYEYEYTDLVTALAKVNPAPRQLETDLERLTFIYVGLKDKGAPADSIMKTVGGAATLDKIREALKDPYLVVRMNQHLRGPDVESGYEVVDKALKDAGFADRLNRHHYHYKLSSEGGPTDPKQLDDWVLVGSAKLKTKGSQPVTATLYMDVRDASGKVRRQPLDGLKEVTIPANGSHTWQNLPIGEVYAELKGANGKKRVAKMALRRQKNEFGPVDVGGTPPPKPTRLKPVKPADPKPQTGPSKGIGNFTGTWFSSVGRFGYPHDPLVMSQSGNKVTGTFKHRSGAGTIDGTVNGNTLTFKMTYTSEAEGKTYSFTGTGTFTLTYDGKSFSGRYTLVDTEHVNNGWRGHRLGK